MTTTAQDAGTTSREEFGGNQLEVIAETASVAVAAQARAQVEARYIMAMKRPRNMDVVRLALVKECQRPGFAEAAWFRKPIGKGVEGLSIRFAEAAARCMTNVCAEAMTVYEDERKRILRVCVTDLEANVTYPKDITISKTVERRSAKDGEYLSKRTNSRGDLTYVVAATEDDLLNKENALVSKALRTLIMRLVPGDLIDECTEAIQKTRRSKDAADPDAARKKLIDAFAGLGVQPTDLKDYLGHDVAQCSPAEMDELRGFFTAIRDGEATWKAVVEAKKGDAPATDAPGKGAAGLRSALDKKRPPAPPKEKAPARPIDPETEGDGPPDEDMGDAS